MRGPDPSGDDIDRTVEESVVPVIGDRIDRLRELTPPPGDEQEVDAIYDAAGEALARIEERPALARRGDEVFRKASRLASDYGFQDCAGA